MGSIASMERIGGHPAIDFVNTLGGVPQDPDDEYLFAYGDLVTFAEGSGLISPQASGRLRRSARRSQPEADEVLSRSLDLRSCIDRILRAHIESRPAPGSDLDALRRTYVTALSFATVSNEAGHYDWVWPDRNPSLDLPLWLVASAAVELLRHVALDRLGRCGHCRWLFLDTSRSGSRRWCSMNACGSVMKMRRYRAAGRSSPSRRRVS